MLSRVAFEAEVKQAYLPITKRLTKIEGQINRSIIRAMSNAKISTVYWNKINTELNYLYAKMNKTFRNWAINEIPIGYKRSIVGIQKRIKASRVMLNQAQKTATELLSSNASKQIINGLYRSSVDSFLSASMAGRKNIKNLFIQTQQKLVQESLVNVAVSTGFEMGNLEEAKSLLTSIFKSPAWDIVNTNRFVQAGKFRYKPSYYAEMVARTKFHQAQSQAALVQANNHSTDLMQVSSHNTLTRICIPYEGKIYSISGNDKRFPALFDTPPYHPNCLHLLFPTFETAMEVQGTLKSFSDFSKGKIDRPPVPSGFIPVDKRGIKIPGTTKMYGRTQKFKPRPSIAERQKTASSVGRETLKLKPTPSPTSTLKRTSTSDATGMPNLQAKIDAATGAQKKYYEEAFKSFKDAPDALKRMVNEHTDFSYLHKVQKGWSGSYTAKTTTINVSDVKGAWRKKTFRHEIGHHIDNKIGGGGLGKTRTDWSYGRTNSFRKAVDNDADKLLSDVKRRSSLNKTLNGSKMDEVALSDFFEAVTRGKVKGYFGHGMDYYNRVPDMVYGEPYADLIEIYGRKSRTTWNFLQKQMPETTSAFEKLVLTY